MGAGGSVIVPPTEYDPTTETIPGEMSRWTGLEWWSRGRGCPSSPSTPPTPFAWALIRLDGAATALLHVVDSVVRKPSARATGSR